MEIYYRNLLITSLSISIFYLSYLLIFSKENNLKLVRFFILSAILFSLILPMNRLSIEFPGLINHTEASQELDNRAGENNLLTINNEQAINERQNLISTETVDKAIDFSQLWVIVHLCISAILLIRMLLSILKLISLYSHSTKRKQNKYTYILLDKRIIPFSFFNWIFIDKMIGNEGLDQITAHEKAHANQIHTFDLILIELLVAAMWFNPFIWMFKNALLQVHEYLADDSVLKQGYNKLEYQSLLVNRAAEDRLVAVSSNFSYLSIKKRIIMMSKTKTHGKTGVRLILLISLISILSLGVSCFNTPVKASSENEISRHNPPDTLPNRDVSENELIAAVAPTKMNVLYIGVDNPMSIAVTGTEKENIKVIINNGSIVMADNGYIVRVKQIGTALITVKVGDKDVASYEFRVKTVPNPIAIIKGFHNQSNITREQLIDAQGILILMQNFDFDISFKVISFSLSTNVDGNIEEATQTGSALFSKEQLSIINSSAKDQKIYIEDIKVKGPDGNIRKLGALVIKIK